MVLGGNVTSAQRRTEDRAGRPLLTSTEQTNKKQNQAGPEDRCPSQHLGSGFGGSGALALVTLEELTACPTFSAIILAE